MDQGIAFKSNRYKSKSKGYDYERIGRAKCYSHGSKGLYRLRNNNSCDKLKEAGCVWKDDDGGFCDLPSENNSMMNDYLSKRRTKTKGALRKKTRGKKLFKSSKKINAKLSKTIDSKTKKYRKRKKTKKARSKKSMSTGKGGLKIFKKLKKFLKDPVYEAVPPSMSELGRFTIRGEGDVILLTKVQTKIQEVSDYRDNQAYCSNCNDTDGGCVMCHHH